MVKKILATVLVMWLPLGCVTIPTIETQSFAPFLAGEPLSSVGLQEIRSKLPKDAVFADLLQAYALMRTAELNDKGVRKEILGLLSTSVSSFEDMTGPINFSKAFSADESKPFRGSGPHERMFASLTAGIFHLADHRCDLAMPYFRNAEFLDARFQKMPFGTDAPLVYALMYRCLKQQGAPQDDLNRAQRGLYSSVRFLTMQEPLIAALTELSQTDLRTRAIANRLGYLLFEVSIYHSLLTLGEHKPVGDIIDDATKNAQIFISALNDTFADDFQNKIMPQIAEEAQVLGLSGKNRENELKELALHQVGFDVKIIGERMKLIFSKIPLNKSQGEASLAATNALAREIIEASLSDQLMLTFTGFGPRLEREGDYQEISVVKPGQDANLKSAIRSKDITSPTSCGFHRLPHGDFSLVLCNGEFRGKSMAKIPSLELLSLTRKARSVQGRKFERVLKGRAEFRAATEKVSEVSLWSALVLFHLGDLAMKECRLHNRDSSCYNEAYVFYALGGATVIFTGVVFLAGRLANPAADSRYIHLMYESIYMSKGGLRET